MTYPTSFKLCAFVELKEKQIERENWNHLELTRLWEDNEENPLRVRMFCERKLSWFMVDGVTVERHEVEKEEGFTCRNEFRLWSRENPPRLFKLSTTRSFIKNTNREKVSSMLRGNQPQLNVKARQPWKVFFFPNHPSARNEILCQIKPQIVSTRLKAFGKHLYKECLQSEPLTNSTRARYTRTAKQLLSHAAEAFSLRVVFSTK